MGSHPQIEKHPASARKQIVQAKHYEFEKITYVIYSKKEITPLSEKD